jgi:type II secretory pathway component PulF
MENAQLTLADLASIHTLIDAACTRGAFKAPEMSRVGEIYDKLSRFLEAAAQQAQEQTEQAPPQGDTNA